ncbi:MAG: redoxin domain-containing protein [Pyrinomonadaceae bacterium]
MSISRNGKPNTLSLWLLVISAVLFAACNPKGTNTSNEATPILTGAPNTTYPMPPVTAASSAEMGWTLLDGQRARLADYRGKVLVLDFYATWCAPCRKSIPHLVELQQGTGAQGLQVIGLNVGGPDDRVKVASFASEFHISYPLGFPDKPLNDLFLSDNDTIPQTFVFDRKGQLVRRIIGYDDSTTGKLEQVIRSELISGSQ